MRVPLLPKALEIVERYKDHKFNPVSSHYQSKVKQLSERNCRSLRHHKNLTFHLARHTFATTVTLTNGVPIESVSKMLGHSTITTTQIYAKVIERKLSEDMKSLKERLAKSAPSHLKVVTN